MKFKSIQQFQVSNSIKRNYYSKDSKNFDQNLNQHYKHRISRHYGYRQNISSPLPKPLQKFREKCMVNQISISYLAKILNSQTEMNSWIFSEIIIHYSFQTTKQLIMNCCQILQILKRKNSHILGQSLIYNQCFPNLSKKLINLSSSYLL